MGHNIRRAPVSGDRGCCDAALAWTAAAATVVLVVRLRAAGLLFLRREVMTSVRRNAEQLTDYSQLRVPLRTPRLNSLFGYSMPMSRLDDFLWFLAALLKVSARTSLNRSHLSQLTITPSAPAASQKSLFM